MCILKEKPKIVVFGSTGNQGGAVVRQLLLTKKWNVVAVTRDTASVAAAELRSAGALTFRGDPADQASLQTILLGVCGVFAVTQPWSPDYRTCRPEHEVIQGKNIIWACKEAGVKHIIFSSVFNPGNRGSGVFHFKSKQVLEDLFKSHGLPVTVLRCGIFMDNIGSGFIPLHKITYSGFLEASTEIPLLSYEDLGQSVARVFDHPEFFKGRTIELAGDIASAGKIAEYSRILSRGIPFVYTAAPQWFLLLFQRQNYWIRRYFEGYSSGEGRLLADQALIKTKGEFEFLITVYEFMEAHFPYCALKNSHINTRSAEHETCA